MTPPDVSIVVPLYNEAENLPSLLEEILAALSPRVPNLEMIFVDDGSEDDSLAVLRRLAAGDDRVRILRLARHSGQTAAFDAGFRAARAPVLVTLDADLQNDPADIPRLLAALADCDVVCGVRVERQDGWLRRASSGIANAVRNRLTRESIADVGCSLRAMRREFSHELPPFRGMHRFLPTLLRLQGARVKELPVRHRPRLHGRSKYGTHDRLWVGLADLFAVRWMQRRWIDRRLVSEEETAGGGSRP